MKNNTSLIIWGTKRGHSIFYTSDGISRNDPLVENATKDIRSYVRFNRTGLKFYCIEFSDQKSIFTLFRTVNDWANRPGYIAFTIVTPHFESINWSILEGLNEIDQDYFKKYINERDQIENTQEDFKAINEHFLNVVNSVNTTYQWNSSHQKKSNGMVFYNNNKELENYLKDPYRNEYKNYRRVFFLQGNLKELRDFKRNFDILSVKPVDDRYQLDLRIHNDDGIVYGAEKKILINGIEHQESHEIRESDSIKINVSKQYFNSFHLNTTKVEYLDSKNEIECSKSGSKITLDISLTQKSFSPVILIKDKQGNPISGARVTLNGKKADKTNNGQYIFKELKFKSDPELAVKADNYEPHNEKLGIRKLESGNIPISLTPRPPTTQKSERKGSNSDRKNNPEDGGDPWASKNIINRVGNKLKIVHLVIFLCISIVGMASFIIYTQYVQGDTDKIQVDTSKTQHTTQPEKDKGTHNTIGNNQGATKNSGKKAAEGESPTSNTKNNKKKNQANNTEDQPDKKDERDIKELQKDLNEILEFANGTDFKTKKIKKKIDKLSRFQEKKERLSFTLDHKGEEEKFGYDGLKKRLENMKSIGVAAWCIENECKNNNKSAMELINDLKTYYEDYKLSEQQNDWVKDELEKHDYR